MHAVFKNNVLVYSSENIVLCWEYIAKQRVNFESYKYNYEVRSRK